MYPNDGRIQLAQTACGAVASDMTSGASTYSVDLQTLATQLGNLQTTYPTDNLLGIAITSLEALQGTWAGT
jgi:hypothetical protein